MTRQSLRSAALETAASCLDRARAHPREHDNPIALRRAASTLHDLVRQLDRREPADTAPCIPRWRRTVDEFHRNLHARAAITSATASQFYLDIDHIELSTAATEDGTTGELKNDVRTS